MYPCSLFLSILFSHSFSVPSFLLVSFYPFLILSRVSLFSLFFSCTLVTYSYIYPFLLHSFQYFALLLVTARVYRFISSFPYLFLFLYTSFLPPSPSSAAFYISLSLPACLPQVKRRKKQDSVGEARKNNKESVCCKEQTH